MNNLDAIVVNVQDEAGHWVPVGVLKGEQDGIAGSFIYDENYNGPPLAPTLDYRQNSTNSEGDGRLFTLPAQRMGAPRSLRDLHPLFESALPGKAGELVIETRSPGFSKMSPFNRLATLASLGDWRSAGMMFRNAEDGMDFRAVRGLVALTALNDEINSKVLIMQEKGFLPTGMTIGRREDQWALATNRSEAFTVEVIHQGQFYVASAAREIVGGMEEGRVEAGLLRASEGANIPTADRLLHESPATGEAILLTRRTDTAPIGPMDDSLDMDDEDNVPSRRTHKIAAFIALDATERTRLDYVDLADFLREHGSAGGEDVKDLYARMMLNAFADNTNDHLGQFELLQDGEQWRLAPAHGLTISHPGEERPHALTMAGSTRPEFTPEWIDRTSDGFGIERNEGREIATRVLREVARLPEYWRAYGVSDESVDQLQKSTATPLHATLSDQLNGNVGAAVGFQRHGPQLGMR